MRLAPFGYNGFWFLTLIILSGICSKFFIFTFNKLPSFLYFLLNIACCWLQRIFTFSGVLFRVFIVMLFWLSWFKLASSQALKFAVTGFSSLHEMLECFSESSFDFTFFSALQDFSDRLWIFFEFIGELELETFGKFTMEEKLVLSDVCKSG